MHRAGMGDESLHLSIRCHYDAHAFAHVFSSLAARLHVRLASVRREIGEVSVDGLGSPNRPSAIDIARPPALAEFTGLDRGRTIRCQDDLLGLFGGIAKVADWDDRNASPSRVPC